MVLAAPPLLSSADQDPELPPGTRVSATPAPLPAAFQPDRSVSRPGLPTRFGLTATAPVAVAVSPAESVTVMVTV